MKHLLFFLLPLFATAQEAPKHATTVIIRSTSVLEIGTALIAAGYDIQADDRFQTIKTDWVAICPDCAPEIMLKISIKDSCATITGQWRTNAGLSLHGPRTGLNSERAYIYPLKNDGPKVARECFAKMTEFAAQLNHEIIFK